jgi:hypothetical protein
MPLEQQKPSGSLAEQRTSNELVKLIRKLRWMGMEEEAEKVENQLTLRDIPAELSRRRARQINHRDGAHGHRGRCLRT